MWQDCNPVCPAARLLSSHCPHWSRIYGSSMPSQRTCRILYHPRKMLDVVCCCSIALEMLVSLVCPSLCLTERFQYLMYCSSLIGLSFITSSNRCFVIHAMILAKVSLQWHTSSLWIFWHRFAAPTDLGVSRSLPRARTKGFGSQFGWNVFNSNNHWLHVKMDNMMAPHTKCILITLEC